ncbi:MAG: reverse transcriptase domain-containing protein [Ferruginibacter sp.]
MEIKDARDLASVLDVSYQFLMRSIYSSKGVEKYYTFEINKKSGGTRIIEAPNQWLKTLQTRLNLALMYEYLPKSCVHGFVLNRSIVSNAKIHLRKKNLINFDLRDFFPSIHFGRVKGFFKGHPFMFNDQTANILANICCNNGKLPQGAPTSPVISNYICRSIDNELLKLCLQNKCSYTRYADDISISTNLLTIPSAIGEIVNNELFLSNLLIDIITKNGFALNPTKTRYAAKNNRREVTGLIVNKKINVKRRFIKNVRLLLHNWEKFGIESASQDYYHKHSAKKVHPNEGILRYSKELVGKIGFIGFIKGKDDPVYGNLVKRIRQLEPEAAVSVIINDTKDSTIPLIYGEGKSDWKHFKAAYDYYKSIGQYKNLNIKIRAYDGKFEVNNDSLLNICESLPRAAVIGNIVICVFDSDHVQTVNKTTQNGQLYKYWRNNVYSMILPKPPHRGFKEISVEHYYLDDELKTLDVENRRIFTSDEFNSQTGHHLTEPISFENVKMLNRKIPFIIDDKVLYQGKNIALPKNKFADYILEGQKGFNHFRFQHFALLFDEMSRIINNHIYEK